MNTTTIEKTDNKRGAIAEVLGRAIDYLRENPHDGVEVPGVTMRQATGYLSQHHPTIYRVATTPEGVYITFK